MTHTLNELVTAEVAATIADGDLVFVGVGTNGRAFTLAVGIPLAALRLAQLTHAPSASVYWGNLLEPDLSTFPANLRQDSLTRWPAAASPVDVGYKCDMLMRRGFDVSFDSGAQIDAFGNLNITAIGDYETPRVRLVGCLAQPEHFAFVRRPIVMMDLSRRSFVEKVDFVTSVGHARDGRTREEWGLGAGGPQRVVTDKAIFDFETPDRRMRLRSLHPGVEVAEVLDSMSLTPVIPDHVPRTAAPDAHQLALIRETIDPNRILLKV
ncbi:CoA-transferase subunit beta [Labrys wisconsinensis]|uniref:Glutaconate CoA-transferase subunit B n=1 Tax=Labrys wisconsinensis TaxID=425677 RepID=A0ABU0JM03_9HYPH|nr:CoA-transferase [Labrys wisconsinensis]MDQ0475327.1 glutaconate CoA-transferase subunit B [Labrys wisconsinensis]